MDETQLSLDLKIECQEERRVKELEEKEQTEGSNQTGKRHYLIHLKHQVRECRKSRGTQKAHWKLTSAAQPSKVKEIVSETLKADELQPFQISMAKLRVIFNHGIN